MDFFFFPREKRWQRMFLTNRCQFNAATYTIPTLPCRGFLSQSHNVLVSRGNASDYLKVDSISNSQQPCFKLSCGDWLKKTAWRPPDPGSHLHIWHLLHTLISTDPLIPVSTTTVPSGNQTINNGWEKYEVNWCLFYYSMRSVLVHDRSAIAFFLWHPS